MEQNYNQEEKIANDQTRPEKPYLPDRRMEMFLFCQPMRDLFHEGKQNASTRKGHL
jgi:hypothetical protein